MDTILEAIIDWLVEKVKDRTFTRAKALTEVEQITILIVRKDVQDALPLYQWLQERLDHEGLLD